MPCCPVCATCTRRSPTFFVRRIFTRLISSSTRNGSLTSPADGRHYAPERPQPEAAGQRHSRNRHARTHHHPRGKAAIVGGAIGYQSVRALSSPCCCMPDDVEPGTCVASLREEFASHFAGVRLLHGGGLHAVYRPL